METIYIIIALSMFVIVYAMIGYPLLLKLLNRVLHPQENVRNYGYEPTATYMIVAHNEEKVIYNKLVNATHLNYPKEKFEILVASDNSTDKTNDIVQSFIEHNEEYRIRLYTSDQHMGKTNAQNEAQKTVTSEILVMTDANSMVKEDAIKELVSSFTSDDIVYVCGKLVYSNQNSGTGSSESTYWNIDLFMRDVESRLQTITAGNGAIYACRNAEYIDFPPIHCHDSSMPYAYALQGKRAIFNSHAIAIEKTGGTNKDEFTRKVRMNRNLLQTLVGSFKTLNVFKYRWFSLFYFSHRTCRYALWIAHITVFTSSMVGVFMDSGVCMTLCLLQLAAYALSYIIIKFEITSKFLRMFGYYCMTVCAQIVGVYRIITGKTKPVWEKVESTR